MKLLLATIAITVSLASVYAQKPNTSVDERVKQLHKLLDEQWEYTLRTGPEFASILGDKRYNDKLGDNSQAAIDSEIGTRRKSFCKSLKRLTREVFRNRNNSTATSWC